MIISQRSIVMKRFTNALIRLAISEFNDSVKLHGQEMIIISILVTAWGNQEINK